MLLWMNSLLAFACFLASIWYFNYISYGSGFMMLLVAIAIPMMMRIMPKLRYRRSKTAYEAHSAYTFYDDHFHVKVSAQGTEGEVTAQYSRYSRVMETQQAFYLKTPEKDYIILPKHCMSSDQTQKMHALLANKYGEKFTVDKKFAKTLQEET